MTDPKRSALLVQALEEERDAALVRAEKAEACEKTLLRQWNDACRERDRITSLWHEWHDRAARAEARVAKSAGRVVWVIMGGDDIFYTFVNETDARQYLGSGEVLHRAVLDESPVTP